jgi:hypothetical protein
MGSSGDGEGDGLGLGSSGDAEGDGLAGICKAGVTWVHRVLRSVLWIETYQTHDKMC